VVGEEGREAESKREVVQTMYALMNKYKNNKK
jgi:hypothetical protein